MCLALRTSDVVVVLTFLFCHVGGEEWQQGVLVLAMFWVWWRQIMSWRSGL